MERLRALVERVAASRINVLILGETGVGKERLAETVHRLSPRAQRPLVRLNCAALVESLLESELFGHERGAFTGAAQAKQGLLEVADRGTIFLDEVGEMPAATQVKLLRVLEQREVLRVGAVTPRSIDVRIVAATNRDLVSEVERGAFRKDLYFRLNGITVHVPPLRRRTDEIERLALVFAEEASRQLERERVPTLSARALERLERHAWPGNIRELRNVVERAVLLSGDGPVEPEHLLIDELADPRAEAEREPPARGEIDLFDERQRILEALRRSAGNQTLASRLLGMPLRTLVRRIEAYDIPRPRRSFPQRVA